MSNTTRWIAIIVAVGIAIAASRFNPTRAESGKDNMSSPGSVAPQGVEVIKPQRATMSRVLDVPATIEAFEQADLYARTSGYISDVRVDIGDRVSAGQLLVQLDVPDLQKQLVEAQARHRSKIAAQKAAEAVVKSAGAHITQAQKALNAAQHQQTHYDADLVLQEITYKRKQALVVNAAATQQEVDDAKARFDVASADAATQVA